MFHLFKKNGNLSAFLPGRENAKIRKKEGASTSGSRETTNQEEVRRKRELGELLKIKRKRGARTALERQVNGD